MMQIKGRLERRAENWVFVSTAFTPPAGLLMAFWRLSRDGGAAGRRYLDKRSLEPPTVDWDAVHELWLRARNT